LAIGDETDCEEADLQLGSSGDCGSRVTGTVYLCVYLVLTFLNIVNMYIAVILENYSQASWNRKYIFGEFRGGFNLHPASFTLHPIPLWCCGKYVNVQLCNATTMQPSLSLPDSNTQKSVKRAFNPFG